MALASIHHLWLLSLDRHLTLTSRFQVSLRIDDYLLCLRFDYFPLLWQFFSLDRLTWPTSTSLRFLDNLLFHRRSFLLSFLANWFGLDRNLHFFGRKSIYPIFRLQEHAFLVEDPFFSSHWFWVQRSPKVILTFSKFYHGPKSIFHNRVTELINIDYHVLKDLMKHVFDSLNILRILLLEVLSEVCLDAKDCVNEKVCLISGLVFYNLPNCFQANLCR